MYETVYSICNQGNQAYSARQAYDADTLRHACGDDVRTVVVTSEMSPRTQQAVERLAQSEYFVITQTVNTPREAEQLIRSQKADMALVFVQNRGMQIMVDGSDPNMAQQWTTYALQTIAADRSAPATLHAAKNDSPITIHTSLLYNPQMKSAYNFVPAIMGMLLMLICAMMTSISIVREKEKGYHPCAP